MFFSLYERGRGHGYDRAQSRCVTASIGAEASHAWCELYLPPHGWVGIDPTNDALIDDRFARVGIGRDYRDVSPVRGVYKGASRSTMSVNVEMEPLAAFSQQ